MNGPIFINFTNRDTGQPEWVAVDRIFRVMPCPDPAHAGYALIWLDVKDGEGNALAIEANISMEDFMAMLTNALEG